MSVDPIKVVSRSPVHDDWVPKEGYLDPEFAKLERQRLWPKVWQVACREEELAKPGHFVTFDVANESFLVVRSDDNQIRAFHNVCVHRGRRLVNMPAGHAHHFTCGYHAWRYNLDGSIRRIPDREDWGDKLPACFGLQSVRVETWGGFVFINMDPNARPLIEFLGHAYEVLNPFEFEKMRYRSIRTARLPVNWKVAVEAFIEGYHVQGTHPQALKIMDDPSTSFAYGPHSMFYQPDVGSRGIGQPSARTNEKPREDPRPGLVGYVEYFERDLKGLFCDRHPAATKRLLTEVAPDASYVEMISKMVGFWRDAAIESGAGWPEKLTGEMAAKAGIDWHLFPNFIILMTPESAICYRVRPDGENPESCFFDLWAIQRYAPGKQPALTRAYYDPWRENADWGEVYTQDFSNAEWVQKGMKSSGFVAARPSPKQEIAVSNFHKYIYKYLGLSA